MTKFSEVGTDRSIFSRWKGCRSMENHQVYTRIEEIIEIGPTLVAMKAKWGQNWSKSYDFRDIFRPLTPIRLGQKSDFVLAIGRDPEGLRGNPQKPIKVNPSSLECACLCAPLTPKSIVAGSVGAFRFHHHSVHKCLHIVRAFGPHSFRLITKFSPNEGKISLGRGRSPVCFSQPPTNLMFLERSDPAQSNESTLRPFWVL